MDEIIEASDAVLIDRGDLSREVQLEQIPYFQKAIVRRANRWHTPLYVATNLLESMVVYNRPTIAEMNDIANTLLDGAHGLVARGRDGHRRGSRRSSRHGQAGRRGVRAGGLRSAHRRRPDRSDCRGR